MSTRTVFPGKAGISIVIEAGKLVMKSQDTPLRNPSFEKEINGVMFAAYGDVTRHRGFAEYCKQICTDDSTASEKPTEEQTQKLAWCHYHKAEVGHVMDACPDVTCRKCHAKGHTDRVCTATPCGECEGYGHSTETCRHRKCEACGKEGHSAEKCYSKSKCEKCGREGHPTEKCYSAPKKPVWCVYHQVEGDHPTSECPDLKTWECENCGEKGHYFKNCHNPHIVRSSRRGDQIDSREFIYASGNAQPLRSKPKKIAQQ